MEELIPSAGPCGTANIAEPSRFAFRWTVAMLMNYSERWGQNPLAIDARTRAPARYTVKSSAVWA